MKTAILALLILVTSCKEHEANIVFGWRKGVSGNQVLATYVWYKGDLIASYRDYESLDTNGCGPDYCFVSLIDSAVIAKRHAQGMALINALRSADKLINELEK